MGGNDGHVRIFASTTGRLVLDRSQSAAGRVIGPDSQALPLMSNFSITAVAWNARGDTLASGSAIGSIMLFHVNEGWRDQTVWLAREGSIVQELTFNPAGTYLATAMSSSVILMPLNRSPAGAVTVGGPMKIDSASSGAGDVAFSPDGQLLAASFNLGEIRLYSVTTRKRLGLVRSSHEGHSPANLVFSPDGRLIAGSNQTRIYLFSVRQQRVLEARSSIRCCTINSFWFMPDGGHLVAAGLGDSVLWIRPVDVSKQEAPTSRPPRFLEPKSRASAP